MRARAQARDSFSLILFVTPLALLLLWYLFSSNQNARLLLSCYIVVATPLYVLTGSYPPVGSRWFWKAMLPIAFMLASGCLRSGRDNRMV
jgi:hypothetical protein